MARWFNTAGFAQAQFGHYGTSPRTDAFRPAGVWNFDFSAHKAFRIRETSAFDFRAEFFNLFNQYNPDPATVDTNLNSATFGSIAGGLEGRNLDARDPVRRQAALLKSAA